MKYGPRKPSIKKSIKARTTGKIKRKVKKALIPGYGKKRVGLVKHPKRALYNRVYNKTTFSVVPRKHKHQNKRNMLSMSNSQRKKEDFNLSVQSILFIMLSIILLVIIVWLL